MAGESLAAQCGRPGGLSSKVWWQPGCCKKGLAIPIDSGGGANRCSSATNALGSFSGVCQRNTYQKKCLLSTLAGSQGAGLCCCTPPLTASP